MSHSIALELVHHKGWNASEVRAVRFITFEADQETGMRSVVNIHEFDLPIRPAQIRLVAVIEDWMMYSNGEVEVHLPDGFTMPPRVKKLSTKLQRVFDFLLTRAADRDRIVE